MSTAYAPGYDPTAVMGRRIVAYIIDFCIAGIVFVGLFLANAESSDKADFGLSGVKVCDAVRDSESASVCLENDDTVVTLTGGAAVALVLVPLGISFSNLVLLQGATGASIGKYITGIRVVNEHGTTARFGRAFIRWLLLIIDTLCIVLGLIVAIATKPHRRVGDFVAGTYVIGKADVGTPIDAGPGIIPGRAVGAVGPYSPPPPPAGFSGGGGVSGWSPPGAPAVPTTPAEAPTTEVPTSGAPALGTSAPQWDAQRNAWLAFDAARNTWLRYDDAAAEWRPLD